jgi:copper chaperone CopZ
MHCIKSVKDELSKLELKVRKVEIGSAEVEFDRSKVTIDQIEDAIKKAGYKIIRQN